MINNKFAYINAVAYLTFGELLFNTLIQVFQFY